MEGMLEENPLHLFHRWETWIPEWFRILPQSTQFWEQLTAMTEGRFGERGEECSECLSQDTMTITTGRSKGKRQIKWLNSMTVSVLADLSRVTCFQIEGTRGSLGFLGHIFQVSTCWVLVCQDWGASQVMLVVKNLPANAGEVRDLGSTPGLGWSPGGGHGNPLQYSCLENPRDRGAWWATAHRAAQSWTWLKRLSTNAHTLQDWSVLISRVQPNPGPCRGTCTWGPALTCQDGPPLALLFHATVLLARQREGRLEDEAVDIVVHFEVRLPVLYFLFLKEWRDIGHLDVGIFGVQILGVHLF